MTAAADYKETTGTAIHPSMSQGYDKCIAATVSAGLNVTVNTNADTNIVKSWTSVSGTDTFSTAKYLGPQARMNNFVFETDVTIKNFLQTGAKGHITMHWRRTNVSGDSWNGTNNRLLILNKGNGKFYYTGNTPSYNAWNNTAYEYFTATSGVDYSFHLTIVSTNTNAYMFVDGVLVAVYMNVSYTATTSSDSGTWASFHIGGELATVEFTKCNIANENLNSSIYNNWLNNDGVVACESNTSVVTKNVLFREATFDVYNDANFTANGVAISLTNTGSGRVYDGVVEDNKLKLYTGTAGALIDGTYNVTATFSGLNVTLYTGASVTTTDGVYSIGEDSEIKFDNAFSAGSDVRDWTSGGKVKMDLANGIYNKLTTDNVHYNMVMYTNITSSYYVAAYFKGDITSLMSQTTYDIRLGFNIYNEYQNGVTIHVNKNSSDREHFGIQQCAGTNFSWTTYQSGLSPEILRDTGYWLVVYTNVSTNTRTIYISDSTGNYLVVAGATSTSAQYSATGVNLIGITYWNNTSAYTMTSSNFRIGSTLQEVLNKTVSISTTNPANSTANVSTSSTAAGNTVTFSIAPNSGYQVSSVTMNGADITGILNKSTFTFIALKDTAFVPTISTIAQRISLTDQTITAQKTAGEKEAYSSRIGLNEFTWQGFMGFPSDTSLDLSVSARWFVEADFFTENGSYERFAVQLLRWDGSVYIKTYKDGDNANTNAIAIQNVPAVYDKLVADKGLNVRIEFLGDSISTYVASSNGWVKLHTEYAISNSGSYVNSIKYRKGETALESLNAVVTNAFIYTVPADYQETAFALRDATVSASSWSTLYTANSADVSNTSSFTYTGLLALPIGLLTSNSNNRFVMPLRFNFANSKYIDVQVVVWGVNYSIEATSGGANITGASNPLTNTFGKAVTAEGGVRFAFSYEGTTGNATISMGYNTTTISSRMAVNTRSVQTNLVGSKLSSVAYTCWTNDASGTDTNSGAYTATLKEQRLVITDRKVWVGMSDVTLATEVSGAKDNFYSGTAGQANPTTYITHFKTNVNIDQTYERIINSGGYYTGVIVGGRDGNMGQIQVGSWKGNLFVKAVTANKTLAITEVATPSTPNSGKEQLFNDWCVTKVGIVVDIVYYYNSSNSTYLYSVYAYDSFGVRYTVVEGLFAPTFTNGAVDYAQIRRDGTDTGDVYYTNQYLWVESYS